MIIKIVPDDTFTSELQPGESSERPVHIVVGTNTHGVNTRGVAHHIGREYNAKFGNLLEGQKIDEVELGHVFTGEGMLDAHQKAMFHAIAVNKRLEAGGPQDWTELLSSLKTGLGHLHLMNSLQEDDETRMEADAELRRQIMEIPTDGTVDFAVQSKKLSDAHMLKTRNHFRVVLIGGADGQKNDANLYHTIQALEETDLLVQLYLGKGAQVLRAVEGVIPRIPTLRARNVVVPMAHAA